MARFARMLMLGALLGPPLAAQSAPWARTHSFTSVETSHDDQPITILRPTVAAWGFLTDWTSIGAKVSTSHFWLSDTASRTLSTYGLTASQTALQGKLTLDGDVSGVSRSWGSSSDWIGGARITAKPAPWSRLSARAEHVAYTSTERSLSADVMPYQLSAEAEFLASGWDGQVGWQDTRFSSVGFVPSGDVDVTTAYAWILAPVPGTRPGALQVGYSFGSQNSTAQSYDLLLPAQPGRSSNFDLTGVYDPYYTPRNVRVHSAIAAVSVSNARASFHANGAYGFHATEDAPQIVAASVTPRRLAPVVTEVPRTYSPWNVRASLSTATTRNTSLVISGELLRTAFYSAQTASIGLDYTFPK